MKAELEKQTKDTINAALDIKWFDFRSYMQKIQTLTASDESYDVLICAQPQQSCPDFTKLAREGRIKDITEIFPKNAPMLYQKYSSEELEYGKVDGKLYAVPSLFPYAYGTYILANAELLEKFNISSISTLDDYEKFLKITKEDNNKLITGTISNGVDTLNLFSRGSGYVILDQVQKLLYKWGDPSMKVMAWETTPEFKTVVGYLASWYKNGYLAANPDPTRTASFVYYGMIGPAQEEPTSMTFTTTSGELKESEPLSVFYLYPDSPVQRDNPMGKFYFNGSFIFGANSGNTERALMFLEWVQQSRENYMLMMYGIENKDYVLKNGVPNLPDGAKFQDRSYMYWDSSWAFQNLDYSDMGSTASGSGSMREFLEKSTKYPPHRAFYTDYSEISKAAEDRSAILTEFENSLRSGLITDMTGMEAFIKRLEDAGSSNIVKLAQKQLDDHISKMKE